MDWEQELSLVSAPSVHTVLLSSCKVDLRALLTAGDPAVAQTRGPCLCYTEKDMPAQLCFSALPSASTHEWHMVPVLCSPGDAGYQHCTVTAISGREALGVCILPGIYTGLMSMGTELRQTGLRTEAEAGLPQSSPCFLAPGLSFSLENTDARTSGKPGR